ncbi:MAG: DUF523 domain-containing protein [Deltaproteobacteria bacterium]|nr:DUF523 domain-containing protein [Deltaproteobacteria bacterium]
MKRKTSSNSPTDELGGIKDSPFLVSGCLLGIGCRYDGGTCPSSGLIRFASSASLIPICPEQLGGLSTPRPSATITGGDGDDVLSGCARVVNQEGKDVTDAYKRGAEESLRLARLTGARIALLRERSPSCGLSTPYCEGKSGIGRGVTAALLHSSGIKVFGILPEDDFPSPDLFELIKGRGWDQSN